MTYYCLCRIKGLKSHVMLTGGAAVHVDLLYPVHLAANLKKFICSSVLIETTHFLKPFPITHKVNTMDDK